VSEEAGLGLREAARELAAEAARRELHAALEPAGVRIVELEPTVWLARPGPAGDRLGDWVRDDALGRDAFVHPRGGVVVVSAVPRVPGASVRSSASAAAACGADADAGRDPAGRWRRHRVRAEARRSGPLAAWYEARELHAAGWGWTGRPTEELSFSGHGFRVPRGVFAPTAASALLLTRVLAALDAPDALAPDDDDDGGGGGGGRVLADIGTGSGVIGVSAALARPSLRVVAGDASPRAGRAARANARRAGLRPGTDRPGTDRRAPPRIRIARADLLAALEGERPSVICANIPYVPPWRASDPGYAAPRHAVAGEGPDGLGLLRRLAREARPILAPGGTLVLQLADEQWDGFAEDLTALGYRPHGPDQRRPGYAAVVSATLG